jgi:hypothetical protein
MQQPVRTSCLGEEAVVVLLVGADDAARMNLARVHEALLRAHQELIETRGTVSRVWMQPPAPAHQTPGAAGHQGKVRRLHRRAVADLDCRRQSMAADQRPPRFWRRGIAHAQLGLWPWRDRKGATMTETLYHPTTPELAARRKELAPRVHEAFEDFSQARLRRRRAAAEDQAADCRRGRPRHAVPLLHQRAQPAGSPQGGQPGGDHGGDLGGSGDARRRRRRARHPCPACDERSIVGRDDVLGEASTSHLPATWRRP